MYPHGLQTIVRRSERTGSICNIIAGSSCSLVVGAGAGVIRSGSTRVCSGGCGLTGSW